MTKPKVMSESQKREARLLSGFSAGGGSASWTWDADYFIKGRQAPTTQGSVYYQPSTTKLAEHREPPDQDEVLEYLLPILRRLGLHDMWTASQVHVWREGIKSGRKKDKSVFSDVLVDLLRYRYRGHSDFGNKDPAKENYKVLVKHCPTPDKVAQDNAKDRTEPGPGYANNYFVQLEETLAVPVLEKTRQALSADEIQVANDVIKAWSKLWPKTDELMTTLVPDDFDFDKFFRDTIADMSVLDANGRPQQQGHRAVNLPRNLIFAAIGFRTRRLAIGSDQGEFKKNLINAIVGAARSNRLVNPGSEVAPQASAHASGSELVFGNKGPTGGFIESSKNRAEISKAWERLCKTADYENYDPSLDGLRGEVLRYAAVTAGQAKSMLGRQKFFAAVVREYDPQATPARENELKNLLIKWARETRAGQQTKNVAWTPLRDIECLRLALELGASKTQDVADRLTRFGIDPSAESVRQRLYDSVEQDCERVMLPAARRLKLACPRRWKAMCLPDDATEAYKRAFREKRKKGSREDDEDEQADQEKEEGVHEDQNREGDADNDADDDDEVPIDNIEDLVSWQTQAMLTIKDTPNDSRDEDMALTCRAIGIAREQTARFAKAKAS